MSTGNQRLEGEALLEALGSLEGWELEGGRLRRNFEFEGFPDAMAFMTRVAFDAERLCHHPNWSNVYNRVEVELWSHDLDGVSTLCIELAAAMSKAASSARR